MKIVHLGKYYFPALGGMESLIRSQAQAQAASGHQVTVVVVNHLDKTGADAMNRSFCPTPSCRSEDGEVVVRRVNRTFRLAKFDISTSVYRTIVELKGEKPDIWHLHTPNVTMGLATYVLSSVCRPLVVTHHSDVLSRSPLRTAYECLERKVYDRADLILSDSPGYIDGSSQLRRYLPKVEVLPIGVETERYTNPCPAVLEWQSKYSQQFGQPLWLSVGRLADYKGLEIAIQAIRNVPGRLAIVGTGPCEKGWRELAKTCQVEDRVSWLGRLTDEQLRGIYRAATALWFPSYARNEGFGIVQVEAMASGCPVINTDLEHTGISWVSPHEKTGLTAKAGSIDSFVECSLRLLNEPGLRDRLARAAQLRACEAFDQSLLNQKCLKLYEDLIR